MTFSHVLIYYMNQDIYIPKKSRSQEQEVCVNLSTVEST